MYQASKCNTPLTRDWVPISSTEDYYNKELLNSRSWDLYKNNPIAKGAIEKIITNVVGIGLKVKPVLDNDILNFNDEDIKKIEKKISILWADWMKTADYNGQVTFRKLQEEFLRNYLIYGNGYAVITDTNINNFYDMTVKVISPLSVKTDPRDTKKDVKDGIIFVDDKLNSYSIYNSKNRNFINVVAKDGFNRRNVLHMFDKKNSNSRSGVSLLSAVIIDLKKLDKFQNAELDGAIATALHPLVVETEKGTQITGRGEKPKESETLKVVGGGILELKPGETLKAITAGNKSVNYESYFNITLKSIGSALEIPPEVIISAFSSNYSASRASILEAWKKYKKVRQDVIETFCNEIYTQFLDEIILKGYIEIDDYFSNPIIRYALQRAEWTGETQKSINPLQEAKAEEVYIKNGLKSKSQVSREMGLDYEQTLKQIQEEQKADGNN